MNQSERHDPIATLWKQFQHNAQQRVDTLQAWLHGEEEDIVALQEAHKLAGALGSFGRPDGSTAAAAVEARLREHLAGQGGNPRHDPDVARLIDQIRRQIV